MYIALIHQRSSKAYVQNSIIGTEADATVVMDDTTLSYMRGSTIDFSRELIGSAFCVLNNPQAEAGCGCGVSFDIKVK